VGSVDPDALLEQLTARQWMEWRMYSEIEPWGYPEQDSQNTFTRLIQAQAGGLTKKDKKAVDWYDMSLKCEREKNLGVQQKPSRRQTKEEIAEAVKRFFGVG